MSLTRIVIGSLLSGAVGLTEILGWANTAVETRRVRRAKRERNGESSTAQNKCGSTVCRDSITVKRNRVNSRELVVRLDPVVRRFLGDHHVVRVRLAEPRRRDPHELRLRPEIVDG